MTLGWLNWVNVNAKSFLPKTVKVDSVNICYDRLDRYIALLLWKYGILENKELSFFLSLIRADTVFVDIGGNMGIYSFRASRIIKEGKILIFEPDHSHFNCLLNTINNNKIPNIIPYQLAVADQNGSITFDNQSLNGGDFFISQKTGGVQVDAIKLDEFQVEDLTKIDIIKMDIQGAEYLALLGMQRIIHANEQLIIFCELWQKGMERLGININSFISFVRTMNLKVYSFKPVLHELEVDRLLNYHSGIITNIVLTKLKLV